MSNQVAALTVAATMASAISLSTVAEASTTHYIFELINTLESVNTQVTFFPCEKKDRYGQYTYQKNAKGELILNEVRICTNKVDTSNQRLLWETLAHEATHVAQQCKGIGVSRVSAKEIQAAVRRRYHIGELRTLYPESIFEAELEAFYMEDQPPEDVITLIKFACGRGIWHF